MRVTEGGIGPALLRGPAGTGLVLPRPRFLLGSPGEALRSLLALAFFHPMD